MDAPNNELSIQMYSNLSGCSHCLGQIYPLVCFGEGTEKRERGKETSITHYLQEICWEHGAKNYNY